MAKCNNARCIFCNVTKEQCMTTPYIINCQCITYRRRVEEKIEGKELMKQPYKANCHRDGGSYKSSRVGLIK